MTKIRFGSSYITGTPEDVQKAVQILDQYISRNATPVLPGSVDTQAENETILTWGETDTVLFTVAEVNPDAKDVLLQVVSL